MCALWAIGVGTGGAGAWALNFFKAGAWSPHVFISHCVANNVIDNFILRY